jgi:hypothetical protein
MSMYDPFRKALAAGACSVIFLGPSCTLYDDALITNAPTDGGAGSGGSGGNGVGGGPATGGAIGSGGAGGSGGVTASGGGGSGGGGDGGSAEAGTGGASTGGADGGDAAAGSGGTAGSGGGSGGSGGSAGSGGTVDAGIVCTSTAKGSGTDGVIDDLDDGNSFITPNDGRAGGWYFATDGTGTTTPSAGVPAPSTGGESNLGMHVKGTNLTGWGASLSVAVAAPGACYDASAYGGVKIALKGSGRVLISVMTATVNAQPSGKQDQYKVTATLTGGWLDLYYAWSDFHQSGYPGATVLPFDTTAITGIGVDPFPVSPLSFEFWVDNVAFARKQ